MATDVVMPRLSLTMKEGTVGKWYKKQGDTVEKGEPIAEIISEKATYDLEAPTSGIVRKILVEQGVDAPVNAILAIMTAPDETLPETEPSSEIIQAGPEEGEARLIASPAAKRLAKEHGVDLSMVKGSGPAGRIVEEDVVGIVQGKTVVRPRVRGRILLSGFRKTSSERISESYRTVPHSTVMMEVSVSRAAELHETLQISYTAIIVRAAAKALREIPIINSTLEGDRISIFEDVNIGVAVATENGLVVPVVHHADLKGLKEIDTAIAELTEKAKQTRLSKEEVTGGTFTVTNLGMYGVDFFVPIINPPEAAILAVGRIAERPVSINGKLENKPFMTLSLAYDHRIVDGVPASQFLRSVKERIERTSGL